MAYKRKSKEGKKEGNTNGRNSLPLPLLYEKFLFLKTSKFRVNSIENGLVTKLLSWVTVCGLLH